jgi:ubiquinone/menaquinone biosynthesis C-methylase UbiE
MRAGFLDKAVMGACGCVQGLEVLDVGCGEGRFCRMLVDHGAERVLGVDLCEPMIEAARELATGRDSYRIGDAQDLSFLADRSFDLAISYLNQCDLSDFAANCQEVSRILRPGGRLVVCNLHPMRSATGGWQKNADGSKQHAILDCYFDEGERHWNVLGAELTNFHRTLSTYVRKYRKCGLAI